MKARLPFLPTLAAVLLVVVLATEAWWLRREQVGAARARADLAQKAAERDWLAKRTPTLDADNEQAILKDLEHARAILTDTRASLRQGEAGPWIEAAPKQSLEEYFDIASFIERHRAAAAAAKVGLRTDERFGFAAYANEGPAPDLLPVVHRQRVITQGLVDRLIEAHPLAVLSVRREQIGPSPLPAKNLADDYFSLDRGLSVRRPGAVDTMAFRLEFSGQTATLRNFLTSLGGVQQPFVIRSVDVEPLPTPNLVPAGGPEGPVPLVRQNLSKFAVVVEFILLATTPVPAAP